MSIMAAILFRQMRNVATYVNGVTPVDGGFLAT
jgi:hypothetical protein